MEALFAVNDPLDVLDYLQSRGLTVTLDRPTGQLHVRPRPVPDLERDLIRTNRALLHAVLLGVHTGHAWFRCDECGEGMMRKKSAGQRKCAFTPRCDGRMHRAHGPTDRGVIDTLSLKVDHPARFSKELLPVLGRALADWRLPVHDPFGGTGERLGRLCDELGLEFTGTELEPEWIVDTRVRQGDSTDAGAYPTGEYVIATSPTYPNGMADHFKARDDSHRNTYRQALQRTRGGIDRELHPNNTGRYNNRRGQRIEARYWQLCRAAVAHWPGHVVVNVKNFHYQNDKLYLLVAKWTALLEEHGYTVRERVDVPCPGNRYGANRQRVETEAVLVCEGGRPMSHWYVTAPDDITEPYRIYNLDRADSLFVYSGRELCARFGTAHFSDDESHIPTIYEGDDAEDELGRILSWLDGGPDPCKRGRAVPTGEAE
jgi:hypothetical protein